MAQVTDIAFGSIQLGDMPDLRPQHRGAGRASSRDDYLPVKKDFDAEWFKVGHAEMPGASDQILGRGQPRGHVVHVHDHVQLRRHDRADARASQGGRARDRRRDTQRRPRRDRGRRLGGGRALRAFLQHLPARGDQPLGADVRLGDHERVPALRDRRAGVAAATSPSRLPRTCSATAATSTRRACPRSSAQRPRTSPTSRSRRTLATRRSRIAWPADGAQPPRPDPQRATDRPQRTVQRRGQAHVLGDGLGSEGRRAHPRRGHRGSPARLRRCGARAAWSRCRTAFSGRSTSG